MHAPAGVLAATSTAGDTQCVSRADCCGGAAHTHLALAQLSPYSSYTCCVQFKNARGLGDGTSFVTSFYGTSNAAARRRLHDKGLLPS